MNTKRKRVIVAMSGGVDSSVAAALLKEEGHEVIGVTMRLWIEEEGPSEPHRHCCSLDGIEDARRVCQVLDIPYYVLNFESQFLNYVVDYFCREYARGRTPNPCLACNKWIKFGFLLDKALKLEADYLATGHYALIELREGKYSLLKAIDPAKDQSYFLYNLGQHELKHLTFPLGKFTKRETRRMAQEMHLPVWDKAESQEICFVPNDDYRDFLSKRISTCPGDIVTSEGQVLGRHSGICFYTIGQRRGLGLAMRDPLYVLGLEADSNSVIVGSNEQLLRSELLASELSYISGEPPDKPCEITAKIRYKALEVKATLYPQEQKARVVFQEPQRAITPGQAVVFYKDGIVLGGGTID